MAVVPRAEPGAVARVVAREGVRDRGGAGVGEGGGGEEPRGRRREGGEDLEDVRGAGDGQVRDDGLARLEDGALQLRVGHDVVVRGDDRGGCGEKEEELGEHFFFLAGISLSFRCCMELLEYIYWRLVVDRGALDV